MSNEDEEVEIRERQNPLQAYQITMVIENAPGPFGLIEGSAQYDVVNHLECGQLNAVSGTRSRIATNPSLHWKKISDNTYVATVYPDLIVDEDYYGNGVCRWRFTEARGRLKATGSDIETDFVPAISAEEIRAEKAVKFYFWKGGYPVEIGAEPRGKGFPDFGYNDPNKFRPELQNELFFITLVAKEGLP